MNAASTVNAATTGLATSTVNAATTVSTASTRVMRR